MKTMQVLLVVLGLVAVGALSWLAVRNSTQQVQPTTHTQTNQEKFAESAAAFTEDPKAFVGAKDDAEAQREIEAFVEQARLAFISRDPKSIGDLFDTEVMVGAIQQQGLFKITRQSDRRAFLKGFDLGFRRAVLNMTQFMLWKSVEVRKLKFIAGHHEAMVYLRSLDEDEIRGKVRWWLVRRDGKWRIYDLEELEMGARISTMMSAAITPDGKPAPWIVGFASFQQAVVSVQEGDVENAEKLLKQMEMPGMPPAIEALRLATLAGVILGSERYTEVLDLVQRAEIHNADMPMIHWLRAFAWYGLREFENVIEHAARYEALLGNDADLTYILGESLLELKRKEDAATAFRKGLLDDPQSMDNFGGLCRALGKGGVEEIRSGFMKFSDKDEAFGQVLSWIDQAYDNDALEAAITAYRPLNPQHADLEYYEGLIHWRGERYTEAAASMKASIARSRSEEERKDRSNTYLGIMADAGKAVEAYREASDGMAAFAELMDWIEIDEGDSSAVIEALIKEHEKKHPDDVMLPYHRASLLSNKEDFAAADAELTRGWALTLTEDQRNTYRWSLISARYKTGKAIATYHEIAPKERTFEQLAYACKFAKDDKTLATLIDLHRPHAESVANLAVWEATCAMMQKNHSRAIDLLRTHREAILKDKQLAWSYTDMIFRSLIRAGRLAEAKAELVRQTELEPSVNHKAILAAASGDTAEAVRVLEVAISEHGHFAGYYYNDEDLGPLLKTEPFAEFRKKHPQPPVEE